MSRHRNVRTMNYEDEFYDEDEMYGHSVEDSYCISPATAAQFTFNRDRGHDLSSYMEEGIPEEEDESDGEQEHLNDSSGGRRGLKLTDTEEVKLNSCLEEIHNILGDTIPENILAQTIVTHKFNMESALNELLSQHDAPKPQRQPRINRRNRSQDDDNDFDEFLESLESQSPSKSTLFSNQTPHSGILKFGSSLTRDNHINVSQSCTESSSNSNNSQGQKSGTLQGSDKGHTSQLSGSSRPPVGQHYSTDNKSTVKENNAVIEKGSNLSSNQNISSDVTGKVDKGNKQISLAELANLSAKDTGTKIPKQGLSSDILGLKVDSTRSNPQPTTSVSGKLDSLAVQHDSTLKKESDKSSHQSLCSLVKQTESKLSGMSLKDLMTQHSENKPSSSGLSLKDLIKQDSGSKGSPKTTSLKDLVKQDQSHSAILTTDIKKQEEHQEQMNLNDVLKSTGGPHPVSLKDLMKQGSGRLPVSSGLSLSSLAKVSSDGNKQNSDAVSQERPSLSTFSQNKSSSDGIPQKACKSNVSLKDLAKQDMKAAHGNKSSRMLLTSEKSASEKKGNEPVGHVNTDPGSGEMHDWKESLKGVPRVKDGDKGTKGTEKDVNKQKPKDNASVTNIGVQMDIQVIDTSQNSKLLSKPSVLAKIISMDMSNGRVKSIHNTSGRDTNFPKFSYSYQIRNVKIFSPVKQEIIIPFDFSTPSPDDIVKEKQKGAFTRTGERKTSN